MATESLTREDCDLIAACVYRRIREVEEFPREEETLRLLEELRALHAKIRRLRDQTRE